MGSRMCQPMYKYKVGEAVPHKQSEQRGYMQSVGEKKSTEPIEPHVACEKRDPFKGLVRCMMFQVQSDERGS